MATIRRATRCLFNDTHVWKQDTIDETRSLTERSDDREMVVWWARSCSNDPTNINHTRSAGFCNFLRFSCDRVSRRGVPDLMEPSYRTGGARETRPARLLASWTYQLRVNLSSPAYGTPGRPLREYYRRGIVPGDRLKASPSFRPSATSRGRSLRAVLLLFRSSFFSLVTLVRLVSSGPVSW